MNLNALARLPFVSSGAIGCSRAHITRCSDGTLMTGMRWTFVDVDQCNGRVSVVAYRHEATIKRVTDALAYCLCGPLKGDLL